METLAELKQLYPLRLQERYQLDLSLLPPEKLLEQAAIRRGCLSGGGQADIDRFAAVFLDELRSGRIGRISLEQPGDVKLEQPDHERRNPCEPSGQRSGAL